MISARSPGPEHASSQPLAGNTAVSSGIPCILAGTSAFAATLTPADTPEQANEPPEQGKCPYIWGFCTRNPLFYPAPNRQRHECAAPQPEHDKKHMCKHCFERKEQEQPQEQPK